MRRLIERLANCAGSIQWTFFAFVAGCRVAGDLAGAADHEDLAGVVLDDDVDGRDDAVGGRCARIVVVVDSSGHQPSGCR